MLGHLTALPVILALALVTFALARPAFATLLPTDEQARHRTTFVAVTMAAFLAPSIWLYLGALLLIVLLTGIAPGDRPTRFATMWALLLLAVPAVSTQIPGFGGIAYIIDIDHIRALNVFLLVPAALQMRSGPNRPPLGGIPTDWFVLGYIALQLALQFPQLSYTDFVRQVVNQGIDLFLPYYVFSRVFLKRRDLDVAIAAFVTVATVMAAVALIEVVRSWPLYGAVQISWKLDWGLTFFLLRGNLLRAQAATGHSLALGFTLVMALGLWVYLIPFVRSRAIVLLASAVLVAGLVASLARGSWVGALLMAALLGLTGRNPVRTLLLIVGLAVVVLGALISVPALKPMADMLPFIGTVDSGNVDYRQQLFDISMALLAQSPWFGVPGYMAHMESLRQGQGIIDIVNLYISVALNTGIVGLSLFTGMFVSVVWRLLALRGRLGQLDDESSRVGARLSAQLAAVILTAMFIISTVSGISVIPPIYLMILGFGISCWRLHALGEAAPDGVAVMVVRP